MKVTEEDVRMLFSLYNIHRYFHRNIAVIKQGAMEPKPPVSLPIEDKVLHIYGLLTIFKRNHL